MAISTKNKQETMKLDEYDKKILFHLSVDARVSRKKLAKKLNISQERLHYKINRLIKELIEPAMILNYNLLDIPFYIILAQNLTEETKDKLLNDAQIFASIDIVGKYQHVVFTLTEDIESFCKEFLPDYNFEIFPVIKQIPDSYNPFNIKEERLKLKKDKKIKLDKKDYKILIELAKNPLDSILSLSEKTKIDRITIDSRIEKLTNANIIQVFRFASNTFRLGHISYFLRIRTIPKLKEKIVSAIRQNNYSGFIHKTYNEFFMWYMPNNHQDLLKFTKELEKVDPQTKIDIMQAVEIPKIDPVPKKVIEIFEERSK